MPLIQETATPADGKPAVGSYVTIPFGAVSTQLGHVEGYTRTGKVKVRAWNATQRHWMPNTRTLALDQIIGRRDNLPAHIPAPL